MPLPLLLLTLPLLLLLCLAIYTRYRPGLRQVPGPFLASFLPFDRLRTNASGRQFDYHLAYHQKYGKLVRVGPNHVSISDCEMIPKIYSISSKFHKSNFYTLFDVRDPQSGRFTVPTIFSVRDESIHRDFKRHVVQAYSTTAMKDFEPMVDSCIDIFTRKLANFAQHASPFDLGEWLHWFAFDVISSITFSNRLGFMEQERDVQGIIAAIEGRLMYNSTIGECPSLHGWLLGNPIFAYLATRTSHFFAHLNSAAFIVRFAATQLDRYNTPKDPDGKEVEDKHTDMLAKFKRYRDSGEQVMSDAELLSHAASNIFAGSDTTATTLRSIIYNLCKTPSAYARLQAEIDAAHRAGQLSDPIAFTEAQKLPYLHATIKEALRLHPVVGQLLERLVPAGGAELCGVHLPAGTIVGISPWVAARDAAVYGRDCDAFRPERWLEASEAQLRLMERNNLGFGAGGRVCLGKNVSLFEISKLVPQVLRRFEVGLADEGRALEVWGYWFVLQKGLVCRVRERGGVSQTEGAGEKD